MRYPWPGNLPGPHVRGPAVPRRTRREMIAQSVLLVAQNPSVIETVKAITDSVAHLQLHTAATLDDARAHLERPELFLMLFHLPAGSKDNALRHLVESASQEWPRLSTIILGDGNMSSDTQGLLRAGAAEYLESPFE